MDEQEKEELVKIYGPPPLPSELPKVKPFGRPPAVEIKPDNPSTGMRSFSPPPRLFG